MSKQRPRDERAASLQFDADGLRARLGRIEDPLALLESLFAHSPVPYQIFSADGHPVASNAAFRDMFGSPPPPEYNLLHDEVSARLGLAGVVRRAFAGEAVQTPAVWYDPKDLKHVDGSAAKRVAIACSFFPLRDGSGTLTHVGVAYKDMTADLEARERAETELARLTALADEKDRLASALRDSEEQLRGTLEAADVGTWEWNIGEDRVKWSTNVERIIGVDNFAGTYDAWLALVHPDDRAMMADKVSSTLRTRTPYVAEFRSLRSDGSTCWQSARGYVVGDEAGRPRGLRGVVFDVTARRAAEDALKVPAYVLENMSEAVTLADEHGFLKYTNPAADRMFGYARGELLGKHVTVLNSYPREENERRCGETIAELRVKGEWVGQWANQRKDGSLFTSRSRITGLVLDGVLHWISVQEDITDEVAARKHADALAESLRASERQLRLITDALPALVAYVGPDRHFRFANDAYMTWFGVEPQWLIGKHVRDLLGETGYRQIQPHMERALAGERVQYELEVTLADGRTLYAQMNYVPDKDEYGHTLGYVALIHDMTDRHRAELELRTLTAALRESEARYRSFVNQSTDGIWRIELAEPVAIDAPEAEQLAGLYRSAHLAECNDAMARMYGYERGDELVDRRLGELLAPEDPLSSEYLRAFIANGYRLEAVESHKPGPDGRPRVYRRSLVGVVEDGVLRRAWGTQRDVTSEVEAREQAEAGNRAKDEFLALLGHELRNPLSPILTALELMKMRAPRVFPDERAIIERQVKHVVRLVDDLLDVSRIIRGKVSLERRRVDLASVVDSALELSSPLLEQRAHQIAVEVPFGMIVDADPLRLAQVFANLLTNAAKYTPRGGQITIVGGRSGDRACVRVRDTGIGIRAEMLPNVFALFAQERQALDRSEGGLGLGLAIVESLVELHGGEVEAHSEGLGRGSEFSVYLPACDELTPPASTRPQHSASARPSGLRVLVVDDNEDAAGMIAEVLSDWGEVVRVAHDGPGALKVLESFTPDVALLDIGLPAMDGYELARRVRVLPALSDVRLVAVTGYGQARDREAAEQAGFHEHVVKPVSLAMLEGLMSRVRAS